MHDTDPRHRIDTVSTSRPVRVSIEGIEVARSTRVRELHEGALPIRYYFPRADVRLDLLRDSATVTRCPYKGTARYWTFAHEDLVVPDVAWSYDGEVEPDARPIHEFLAFYNEVVDLEVDGVTVERPHPR